LLAHTLPHREEEFQVAAELIAGLERALQELRDKEWDLNHLELWEYCVNLPDSGSDSYSDD
jgi:hypothetical protein